MGLSKVFNWPYSWPMHFFRIRILLVFSALTFFGTANATRAQVQPNPAATTTGSQPSTGSAQATEARGYWVDPSTGLMWAGKDNGRDANLHLATKYCRELRLAGYSDWRLATIDELQRINDKSVDAPGKAGYGRLRNVTWHIKGNIFLTGEPWSSTFRDDSQGYAWGFDFCNGIRWEEDTSFYTGRRAFCVRGSGK